MKSPRRFPFFLLFAMLLMAAGGLWFCSTAAAAVPEVAPHLTAAQAEQFLRDAIHFAELAIEGLAGLGALAIAAWFGLKKQIREQREGHDAKLEAHAADIEKLKAVVAAVAGAGGGGRSEQ